MTVIMEKLYSWNPWWKHGEVHEKLKGKNREILPSILKWLPEKEVKVLVGPRRSGKSTIFYQIIDHLFSGKIKPEQILLVNFQDSVFREETIENIYNTYLKEFGAKKSYIFLDEAQESKGWEIWVKENYDRKEPLNFLVSGSCASLLKSEYSTMLTGRNVTFTIWPLSFKEYLKFSDLSAIKTREDKSLAFHHYNAYSRYGGFPEVFYKPEELKHKLLLSYLDDIITKDVVERHDADKAKVGSLVGWILSNPGQPASLRSLSRMLGLSVETVAKYLGYLEDAYFLKESRMFSYSVKEQEMAQKKFYPVDLGFLNAGGFFFSSNKGTILENAVATQLIHDNKQLFYYKKEKEVDFIVKEGRKEIKAIQATVEPDLSREKEALEEAKKDIKGLSTHIITENRLDEKVNIYPFWKWASELV